eukprot:TRINITY_DN738_c0_g1_i2.p1 TRINITY_DN738_c0_g1~~TRINITY_DN738_c0_g1_i2.p1  ORF type:complete len:420 (-),score=109.45 TRINITY_DN738_c0_g1_i2:879-2138(-)
MADRYIEQRERTFEEWDRIFTGEHENEYIRDFQQQEFEEVYGDIEMRKEWVDQFAGADEHWSNLLKKANEIPDEGLQSSNFMDFVRELHAQNGGNSDVWADEFSGAPPASQLKEWNDIWSGSITRQMTQEFQDYTLQTHEEHSADITEAKELFDQGHLTESVNVLENYLVSNPNDDQAWKLLGQVQAENDNDTLAIQALNRAIELNPSDLDTLILLGVSHTNNFNTKEVYSVFLQWIHQNPEYAALADEYNIRLSDSESQNHKMVSELFIRAAQLRQNNPDPDVHIVLGVLYNLNFEYERAEYCFREALKKRPDDYQLWNKYGATQANARKSEEAAESYIRALQIKEAYTRSRSNLGIAYMSLRNYHEAAQCFLGALTINDSPHLWRSLNTAFALMRRPDLVEIAKEHNIEHFRDEFIF